MRTASRRVPQRYAATVYRPSPMDDFAVYSVFMETRADVETFVERCESDPANYGRIEAFGPMGWSRTWVRDSEGAYVCPPWRHGNTRARERELIACGECGAIRYGAVRPMDCESCFEAYVRRV